MDLITSEIKDIMSEVDMVASKYGIPSPYLVGGYPRNLYLGTESSDNDLDFTANSGDQSLYLGILFCKEKNLNFNIYNQSHLSTRFRSKKLDFSSGFKSDSLPNSVEEHEREPLSRDFTMDAIHIMCKDLSIYDFTGRGIVDVERRTLDTILEPEIAFSDDPKRIYRALSLSSKYDLKISERVYSAIINIDIEDFVKENYKFITSIVDEAFEASREKTISNIEKMNLYKKIPLFGHYRDYLIESNKIKKYFKGIL